MTEGSPALLLLMFFKTPSFLLLHPEAGTSSPRPWDEAGRRLQVVTEFARLDTSARQRQIKSLKY